MVEIHLELSLCLPSNYPPSFIDVHSYIFSFSDFPRVNEAYRLYCAITIFPS